MAHRRNRLLVAVVDADLYRLRFVVVASASAETHFDQVQQYVHR